MSAFSEFLLNTLVPTLEAFGETKLEGLLEDLAVLEEDNFETDIQGTYSLFKRLQTLAGKTKTKIDDGIIAAVLDAIENVAQAHNIELP